MTTSQFPHSTGIPPVSTGPLVRRLVEIGLTLARRVAVLVVLTVRSVLSGRRARTDTWLLDTITALGPAFIKVAQMLSTRADLLPPRHCRTLAALHDTVLPIPARELAPVLERALGPETTRALVVTAEHGGTPVASGSIACVYRTTLPDGRDVAVKVRRPGIETTLRIDLTIMRRLGGMAKYLPGLRGVPIAEIMTQLGDAVYAQLDFDAERRNLASLQANLVEYKTVLVPEVYDELCTEDVLVMEFLPDLRRRTPDELSEEDRTEAVLAALHAVYQMLFHDGLVHCDLHPGNLYLGPGARAVIVDAGFTVRLTQDAQDKFSSFFYYMSVGKGEKCAEVVLSTATARAGTDEDGFRREIVELIDTHTGVAAAEFDLIHFATSLFDIQRRYNLYADPQFVFPILSLLVLEGAMRDFAPDIDFQDEAIPFLAGAMISRTLQLHRQRA
ncbi:ABC1 kinase family protein [Haloechinothrix salitolerans]|uniref:ABC1 kinase family protein n=1 Tax=Haloechinothrix salitolerans TaxID=926830 RepID=A0ABW2BYV5_9PSEU